MEKVSKYHSVALFVIYTIALNFKSITFIDGFVVSFLAGYIALSFFIQHHKQPDIKAEMMSRMDFLEKKLTDAMVSNHFKIEADVKKIDTDMKEVKTKIASIGSLKSVGLSQTSIKF